MLHVFYALLERLPYEPNSLYRAESDDKLFGWGKTAEIGASVVEELRGLQIVVSHLLSDKKTLPPISPYEGSPDLRLGGREDKGLSGDLSTALDELLILSTN